MTFSTPGLMLVLVALLAAFFQPATETYPYDAFALPPLPEGRALPSGRGAIGGFLAGAPISADNATFLAQFAALPMPGASLLALSPQTPLLAAADPAGMIQIVRYRPESLSVVQTIQTGEPLFSLAFSPDGLWLAAGVSGAVRVYRVIDWAFYARLPVDGDVLSLAQVSRRLAAGTSTGFLYYWAKNLGPGFRLEQSIALRRNQIDQQLFMAPVNSLAASQAFYRIGHGLGDGLWVLDAADGATRTRVSFQPDYWIDNLLTTLAFTPDGRYILCRQYGGTFTLWHISGALLRQVIVPTGPTTSVAISPDSRLAAMGGDRLNLWIIPSLERIKTEAANTPVVSVAFSPDGRLIITLGADHTLRAWGISLY